jgi:hypothetical protein
MDLTGKQREQRAGMGSPKNIEIRAIKWQIPRMKTATVDEKHRIQIPELKPGQVVAYDQGKDETITLTEVKKAESVKDRPLNARLVKRGRYTVVVTDRPIDTKVVNELLKDFP